MTVDPMSVLPPWAEVREAAASYDEARLREVVVATFEPGRETRDFNETISATVGTWYGRSGWSVGNESFGSCWCHSPMLAYTRGPRDPARLTPAVDWVAREVGALVECLRAFAAIFEALPRGASPEAVAQTLDRIIDAVIERTGCQESWYRYVGDGTTWLCDHLGVERGAIESVVEGSINAVFSSWTAPPPGAREAALRAVGDALTASRRDPPEELLECARGMLRPRRPRLAEALAAIEGQQNASAAAEVLVARGLMPEAWLDTSKGGFSDLDKRAKSTPPRGQPRSAAVWALLAADAERAALAQELAQELAHRLVAFGVRKRPSRVVWLLERDVPGYGVGRVLRHHPALDLASALASTLSGAADSRLDVAAWATAVKPLLRRGVNPLQLRARCIDAACDVQAAVTSQRVKLSYEAEGIARLWAASRWWSLLVDAGARLPDAATRSVLFFAGVNPRSLASIAPEGTPLAEVPDLLSALVALWGTGYPLHEINAARESITLLIPKE